MSVRTVPVLGNIVAAMRRPGIDPRINLALAEVVDVGYDTDHGTFADVKTIPDGNEECCMVGEGYAGSDFGESNPLHKQDLVLIGLPMGTPGYGAVLICRLHCASVKPPKEFGDETTDDPTDASPDKVLVIEPGKKYRIVGRGNASMAIEMSEGGDFTVNAKGDSNIAFTAEKRITVNAPEIVLGDGGKSVSCVSDMVAVSVPAMTAGGVPVIPVNPALVTTTGGIAATGKIMSGRAKVKS